MGTYQIHPMTIKEYATDFAIPFIKLFPESIKQGNNP